MALFGLLVVGGLVCVVLLQRGGTMEKDQRRILRRVRNILLTAGCLGWLLYGLVWERVPVLGMRIFFLVWLCVHVYWAYRIWRFAARELPAKHKVDAERAAYEKWLPKPKH